MSKQNIYIGFLNASIGIVFSLLLKGNLLICVLAFILGGTILFIERERIYQNVFKRNKKYAITGYSVLLAVMATVLVLLTQPKRDQSQIVGTVHFYLDAVKAGDYKKAYEELSDLSRKGYPLDSFIGDHAGNRLKVQDYRIDGIAMNEFDKKKAVVQVSSPFLIYGQNTLPLELVKEDGGWKIVFSRRQASTAAAKSPASPPGQKKKEGSVSQFFKKLF